MNRYLTVCLLLVLSVSLLPARADVSKEVIWEAAHVTPAPNQIAWQERELIAFIHFTVNTFTDMEWGTGEEDPSIFNPSQLDPRQWVEVCKEAGMQTVILTAKHHDGFCLWPSQYTDHDVASSPWKNGNGDVVGELAQACREAGLSMGLYLSPWDRHEPTYGDQETYNQFYKNQLREILSNYGDVVEVWFDGAKGKDAKDMEYDWLGYYAIVRELQPQAVIFNGPDIRWVGNEAGYARKSEWSVVPKRPGAVFTLVDPRQKDLGSREQLGGDRELIWYPAETDVSIRPGWFYHKDEDDEVKSLQKLLDIYYSSVGRNSVLLLNLPPDPRGLIHENDVKRLQEFRAVLDATFDENLAQGAQVKASSFKADSDTFSPKHIVDAYPRTYWTTDNWQDTATLEFDLGGNVTFNRAMLQEYFRLGQRIEKFALDYWDGEKWVEFADATTVGYKRILRFDDINARKVRCRILQSRVSPTLSNFGLFYQPPIDEIMQK